MNVTIVKQCMFTGMAQFCEFSRCKILKIFLDRHIPLFKFVSGKEKSVNEMEILSVIKDKPVGLIVSCQGPEEYNTERIKILFDKFCESSLAQCIGKYIFPFCSPDASQSDYDEKVIQQVLWDIHQILL